MTSSNFNVSRVRKVLPNLIVIICFIFLLNIIWAARRTEMFRWQDKPLNVHYLSKEEPYMSRILHIRKHCAGRNRTGNFTIENKNSFKYDDQLELVWCEIPKVASTTWQLLFLQLSGYKENITEQNVREWSYGRFPNKHFEDLGSDDEIMRRMMTYTTFLLTRHPFERLVSAYYDKLSNRSTYQWYQKNVGTVIARQQASEYLHGLDIRHIKDFKTWDEVEALRKYAPLSNNQLRDIFKYSHILQTGEVSFLQFVKYVVGIYEADQVDHLDIHWRPQAKLCYPCHFNYSYVIKFENVATESNRLLDYVQNLKNRLSERHVVFEQTKPDTGNLLTQRTMKQVPIKYVEILRKLYAEDFLLFNYDPYLYSGSL